MVDEAYNVDDDDEVYEIYKGREVAEVGEDSHEDEV